jgi:hypothetical protein
MAVEEFVTWIPNCCPGSGSDAKSLGWQWDDRRGSVTSDARGFVMIGATRSGRVLLTLAALVPFLDAHGPPSPEEEIEAIQSLASLLPEAPLVKGEQVYVGTDLFEVPEVNLEAPPSQVQARASGETISEEQWLIRKSRTAAGSQALNEMEEDGFVKALLRTRHDLSGLPFLMGKACRTPPERAAAFKILAEMTQKPDDAVLSVRSLDPDRVETPKSDDADLFAKATTYFTEEKVRVYGRAHAALLAQTLPAKIGIDDRIERVESLARIDLPEATRELARLAVYSPDENVRTVALDALAKRESRDTTDVLVAGLRYPWPAVAKNAARAIVKLKRTDLIPQLESMLDEPDPRAPKVERDGNREVTVARELVRINHHSNCLLCHAPAVKGKTPMEALTAEIPLPTDSTGGYGRMPGSPQRGLLVRIDVTYLRQDFSAVPHRFSGREETRFDFLVRKRVLTPDEARDLRERLEGPSPYHAAAAEALQQLK